MIIGTKGSINWRLQAFRLFACPVLDSPGVRLVRPPQVHDGSACSPGAGVGRRTRNEIRAPDGGQRYLRVTGTNAPTPPLAGTGFPGGPRRTKTSGFSPSSTELAAFPG